MRFASFANSLERGRRFSHALTKGRQIQHHSISRAEARRADENKTGLAGLSYWVLALLIFGSAAIAFSADLFMHQPQKDVWQHLAALRALIEQPSDPANPFVPGEEGSRLFHPLWVALATTAAGFGWDEWAAIKLGAILTLLTLSVGIWSFGRTYFKSIYGPAVLLISMIALWVVPVDHTGFHSYPTLISGAAYPATLLIGMSLLLWSLTIQSLQNPVKSVTLFPLVALMITIHQLGAVIGLIGCGYFIILYPQSPFKMRIIAAVSVILGVAFSLLWPYFNPIATMIQGGRINWVGPPDFYAPSFLIAALMPAFLGIYGLVKAQVPRTGWPLIASLLTYGGVFVLGRLFDLMVAARFLMPIVLVLHIGFASILLNAFTTRSEFSRRMRLSLTFLVGVCILGQTSWLYRHFQVELEREQVVGDIYSGAQLLTAGIPDFTPIAAYDIAAWPVVAAGQRVVSTPWPEPLIHDLSERQVVTEMLFDPTLSRSQRIDLARRWGVRYLILDHRYAYRREKSPMRVAVLVSQSAGVSRAGPLWRFDLTGY